MISRFSVALIASRNGDVGCPLPISLSAGFGRPDPRVIRVPTGDVLLGGLHFDRQSGIERAGESVHTFSRRQRAFAWTIAAMLVPLVSEFDVALGRTTVNEE